jgi:hypothetical protein
MANYRLGRVALHLIASRGSDFRMYVAGVKESSSTNDASAPARAMRQLQRRATAAPLRTEYRPFAYHSNVAAAYAVREQLSITGLRWF